MSSSKSLKIVFHMMDLVGPQNACIGLGQVLIGRGHQVCFLGNEKFCAKFARYGFRLLPLTESPDRVSPTEENPVRQFISFMAENGIFTAKPVIEKLEILVPKKNRDIFEKAVDFEAQAQRYLEDLKPDFLVIDSDIIMPCLLYSGIPWALLFCSNPVGVFDSPELPPFTSDFSITSDRAQWEKYRAVSHKVHFRMTVDYQNKLNKMLGYPPVEGQLFVPHSPLLNIYQYPAELDYDDVIRIPPNFLRVDAFCREEPSGTSYKLPLDFKKRMKPGDKLIYLSMGSMGSCNVTLMRRLVTILSATPYFYVVAKGLLAEEYQLGENMTGDSVLPQTQVLPLVDLVITHGGNNTLTEAISFGKPLIVLPIFYDQPTNAARVEDKGFGIRLETYSFNDQELVTAIDRIFGDTEMRARVEAAGKRIQATKGGKERAAEVIEQLVKKEKSKKVE